MKRILIPNGSFHDIPLIKTAKEMGYYVITSGNNPDQPGYIYADKYIYGDFSDKDAMLQIAINESVDAVCANCNDFGYLSVCYVAEKLGLPGHESYKKAMILHHKDKFKKAAVEWGLSTPRAESFVSIDDAVRWCNKNNDYPLIVKPVDLGAGQGICKIISVKEAAKAIAEAMSKSKIKHIVIEPFIEGSSHSFNAFVVNRKVVAWYSDNEYMLFNKYRVSTSASPATEIEKALPVLIRDTNKVAEELELPDGLVHSQYIMDCNKKPQILEITRRMSGDWYPYPEIKATGINWMYYIVAAQCGLNCTGITKYNGQNGYTGRHCLNAPHIGMVKAITISKELEPYIYDRVIWRDCPYMVDNVTKDYPGILFLSFPDREIQEKYIEHISSYISFEYVK